MNRSKNRYNFLILTWALLLTILAVHALEFISYFGKGMAVFFFVATVFHFMAIINNGLRLYRLLIGPMFFILLTLFFCILSSYNLQNLGGLVPRLAQLISIFSILLVFYFFGAGCHGEFFLEKYKKQYLYIFFPIIFLGLVGFYVQEDFGFLNPNVLGIWVGLALLIILSNFSNNAFAVIFFVIGFLVIFLSGSRTAAVALAGALILYSIWPVISRRKIIFYAVLVAILSAAALIIFLTLESSLYLSDYNELSKNVSGKNIESGRHIIWPAVISLISQKPWLGWGGGVQLGGFSDFNLSAHNLYLQVLLQIGVLGLASIIFMLFSIWSIFLRLSFDKNIRWAASVFVYVLFCQNFEVTLLQNNMALSWPMWCFISLSIGVASRNIKAK